MGFLKRFFDKIEAVNKGQASAEELDDVFYSDPAEDAENYWFKMEQNLLINAIKAAGGPEQVQRAFVVVDFKKGQETFDFYYQVDGRLLSWQSMGTETVSKLEQQLIPQAEEVAQAVNEAFAQAGVPLIDYAMLQFETASMAWFGRKITSVNPESNLSFMDLVEGWKQVLEQAIPYQALDSDAPLPFFEC